MRITSRVCAGINLKAGYVWLRIGRPPSWRLVRIYAWGRIWTLRLRYDGCRSTPPQSGRRHQSETSNGKSPVYP